MDSGQSDANILSNATVNGLGIPAQKIAIIDAEAQHSKSIARILREFPCIESIILPLDTPADIIESGGYKGIIISGGPGLVDAPDPLGYDSNIFNLKIPILAIAYGMQIMIKHFGGTFDKDHSIQNGEFKVKLDISCALFKGGQLNEEEDAVFSHSDGVALVPTNFQTVAHIDNKIAGIANFQSGHYAVQFHPDAESTPKMRQVLKNFLYLICLCQGTFTITILEVDTSLKSGPEYKEKLEVLQKSSKEEGCFKTSEKIVFNCSPELWMSQQNATPLTIESTPVEPSSNGTVIGAPNNEIKVDVKPTEEETVVDHPKETSTENNVESPKKSNVSDDSADNAVCKTCHRKGPKANYVRNGKFCSSDCAYAATTHLRVFRNSGTPKPVAKQKIMLKGGKLRVGSMNMGIQPKLVAPPRPKNQSIMRTENLDGLDLVDANEEVEDIDHILEGVNGPRFSWKDYLTQTNSYCAPNRCFKDLQLTMKPNLFAVGMKLEGVDPSHPSLYCVLTVVEVVGYRIRLHFDGYPDMYDFWLNVDSPFIFPPGWCSRTGRKLEPPKDYNGCFKWKDYLRQTGARPAPENIFSCMKPVHHSNHPFRVGMKLEAVDKSNESLVCVASISDILDNWLLIHFDGWDESYDYWTAMNSPYIHPVNYCREKNRQLTPPKDYYKQGDKFKWSDYLNETGSSSAPLKAFRLRPPNQFRPGMKLEVVDKHNPRFLRVATITQRLPHSIRIHYDGWDTKFDFWVDDDSSEIHPVNWCGKSGHPLRAPPSFYRRTPLETVCLTPNCRGEGNTKSPAIVEHTVATECPYAEDNFDNELPDRLGRFEGEEADWPEVDTNLIDDSYPPSPDSFTTQANNNSSNNSTKKRKRGKQPSSSSESDSDDRAKTFRPSSPSLLHQNHHKSPSNSTFHLNSDLPTLHQAIFTLRMNQHHLEAPVLWEKHSRNLLSYADKVNPFDVLSWDAEMVANFVSTLPGCLDFAQIFAEESIDGEAFLLLNQNDLVKILGVKLGPAVKIWNSILVIRDNINLEA